MKVYLSKTSGDYVGSEEKIVGVFSTLEKAEWALTNEVRTAQRGEVLGWRFLVDVIELDNESNKETLTIARTRIQELLGG